MIKMKNMHELWLKLTKWKGKIVKKSIKKLIVENKGVKLRKKECEEKIF